MGYTTVINGRYKVWRTLQEGSEGRIFVAQNREAPNQPVVIKSVPRLDPSERVRELEELARLPTLRHPHLNPVSDFGRIKQLSEENGPTPQGDTWDSLLAGAAPATRIPIREGDVFLASPYLAGGDLSQFAIATDDSESLDRLLTGISVQVLSALQYLHDQSLLHFDIKPEHVLLSRNLEFAPGIPHARLIDLGLAARESTPLGNRVRGTYPYIAPEVLDRSMVDARVDLYSFGATLLHALAGGNLNGTPSRENLSLADTAEPADLIPALPDFWNGTIARLLQKRPEDRFPSAANLLEEIRQRSPIKNLPRYLGPTITQRPLPGQEKETDYILRELEKLQIGESGSTLVLLGGDRGVGKSAARDRLEILARLQGIETLRASCRAADAPYDPCSRILLQLHRDPLIPANLRSLIEMLIRWLRDGVRPPEHVLPPLVTRSEERYRLQSLLSEVFIRLDPANCYLVVFEDLHRAAPELLEFIGLLAHRLSKRHRDPVSTASLPEPDPSLEGPWDFESHRSRNVLLLALTDDDDNPPKHPHGSGRLDSIEALAREPFVSRITLKPLSTARSKELMRDLLGPDPVPAGIHGELHQLCGGHGPSLTFLLRECLDAGVLTRERHAWQWHESEPIGARLEKARLADWNSLKTDEQTVLRIISGCEDEADDSELRSLALALGVDTPEQAARQLQTTGWIRRDKEEEPWLRSRPLPEAAQPDADWTQRLHIERSRRYLERRPESPFGVLRWFGTAQRWEEVNLQFPRSLEMLRALHCDATLVSTLAWLRQEQPYLVRSDWCLLEAESLLQLGHREAARELLETLLHAGPPPVTRIGALLRLAQPQTGTPTSRGRECLDEALQLANDLEDRELQVRITLEMGRLHLQDGFQEKALQWGHTSENLLAAQHEESALPDTSLLARVKLFLSDVYAAQNLAERAKSTLRDFLEAEPSLAPAWQSQLLGRLLQLEVDHSRYEQAIHYATESLPIDRELGNLYAAAQALAHVGRIHVNRGEQDQASYYHRRSLHLREEIRDLGGMAASQNNIGLVDKMQNRLDEAETRFRSCESISKELGLVPGQAAALNNLSDIMVSRGDYALALKYAFEGLELRKSANDTPGVAQSYYRIGSIYRNHGELDRAEDYGEKSLEIRRELGDKLHLAYSLQLLGELNLVRGRYYKAFRCLRQSLSNFEALGDKLGRQVLLAQLGDTFRHLGLFEEARDYIDRSLQIANEHSVDYYVAISLKSLGGLLRDQGDLSQSESQLREAERRFRSEESRRDLCLVLLERAHVALELGNPDQGLTLLSEVYNYLEELGLIDLLPAYYRLRGAIAGNGSNADRGVSRKLLQRGLEEARKLDIAEETWRILFQLTRIEQRENRPEAARSCLSQAVEIAHKIHSELPTQFQDSYARVPDRVELFDEWDSIQDDGPQEAPSEAPALPASTSTESPTSSSSSGSEDVLFRLQDIASLLNSERDLDVLLNHIMDQVLDLFRAERGFLILLEEGELETKVARNIDREEITRPEFKYSQSIAREVASTGHYFVTNDAQQDERLRQAHSVHDLRLQAIACFPLEWRDNRLGVVYLENRFRKQLVPTGQVKLLQAFSNQAAVALVNARLYDESERRRRELEVSQERVEELNVRLEARVEEQSRELEATRRKMQLTQDQLEGRYRFHNIIGRSPQMLQLYRLLERIANTELPVLIEGESGTGKELAAHAVHFNSSRRRGAFVSENCGALAESLFESELFGHAKGAFTGAETDREGLVALAEGGTLFLDEVHELGMDVQKKLLRFLQEGVYRPVGGKEFLTANVRILSASNQPLLRLVKEGCFREDLYYRLNVLKVELPPLRDRGQDVLLLARHFLDNILESESLDPREFSPDTLRQLSRYTYPGNVRELRNLVEKAAILAPDSVITPDDLFFDSDLSQDLPAHEVPLFEELPLRDAREEFQRRYLESNLQRNGGVVARAARSAGITRESFHRLMKKYGIQRN